MSRARLLALQVLVAVLGLAFWHLLTTTSLVGDPKKMQFFFSTPFDVLARCVRDLAGGEIWRHLFITLTEAFLAFVIGAAMR